MAVKGNKARPNLNKHPEYGRKGKNENWPGCTEEFVNRTKKRRKKDKMAKKSKKRNRKK